MTNEQLFWQTAASDPHRPAVIVDGGGTTTYGELAETANRLSNGLRARGLVAGSALALVLPNRLEFIALQLAAHQIGLYVVPVNRHLTAPEVGYILGDCGAELVVADSTTAPTVAEAAELAAISPKVLYGVGDDAASLQTYHELLGAAASPDDRVAGSMLFYSSGTTGRPKGIRRPMSGLSPEDEQGRIAQWARAMNVTPDGVFLSVGPLYHAAPNQNMMMTLQLGHTVVVSSGFDPEHALGLIQRHAVTATFLVPTMMHRLLTVPAERRNEFDVSSLRTILHAGSICPVATKRAMIDWVGPVLVEYYGSSESGATTIIDSASWLAHEGSVGQARPGMAVRICDEHGEELPPGTPGLIHLKSGVVIEYVGDPNKTASSYQDGFFVPGDIGYLDEDGWLFVCDRRTDLIISGGVNIYPAEIEGELLQHAAVLDAAVFGVPDDEWGQRVVALVQLRDPGADRAVVTESIAAHCRDRLAAFKFPRVLEVVERLPRTAAGKISRSRLRDSYRSGRSG
ncbi:AMP-binding protein [Rhodococcus jostii]|uniref:AMP-binding protein n=1 Tax=Rhodococcus jostii TaxID=132919 RepID=A0ABU4C9E9_RHOJO|nr:AMP-binding protein [Rhodococcus jostii]MDV6280171.1 AMP-binding protein [Rhodococcus jostii]